VVSRGTVYADFDTGMVVFNFEYPFAYSWAQPKATGDLSNYVIPYGCVDCSSYSTEDIGSEFSNRHSNETLQILTVYFTVHFYVFTRVPNPPCTDIELATSDLKQYNMTLSQLNKISHEECF
jgi:hypothetical protein